MNIPDKIQKFKQFYDWTPDFEFTFLGKKYLFIKFAGDYLHCYTPSLSMPEAGTGHTFYIMELIGQINMPAEMPFQYEHEHFQETGEIIPLGTKG